jgi:amino acid transporter
VAILDLVLGKPLPDWEDRDEKVGAASGIPIFGLDALGSAAYGPEAALTVLIPLGAAGFTCILPIGAAIILLLGIVYFSYRQTMAAYPTGGGSYTVARLNLGASMGLFAAAALMIDYILNAAVGISAGVGALVSAAPSLQPHTLTICLLILLLITLVNLRGVRDTGIVFMVPTYLFVGTVLTAIAVGIFRTVASGGSPVPVVAPPPLQHSTETLGVWILLRAFASGCTAMTGVEAVSNGVQAFKEPVVSTARRTLAAIIFILMLMLAGLALLIRVYRIQATEPGSTGYQSVLSMVVAAVMGKGAFYFVTIGATLAVLSLSANTSFADFPRLCRAVARNGYLPYTFSMRGRRLVYTSGISVLAVVVAAILFLFGGVTDRLIPLFAVGAFLAFTLSQAGMVRHWMKAGGPGARGSMVVNGIGAAVTGMTAAVILVAKFTAGAWITVVLIPCLLLLMTGIKRHYYRVRREIASPRGLDCAGSEPPLVVVPIQEWSRIPENALRFAMGISPDIIVIHVEESDQPENIADNWETWVATPARSCGKAVPRLITVKSPYRTVLQPLLEVILTLEKESGTRQLAVVIPELIERHWWNIWLHSRRAQRFKALLYLKGNQRILTISIPWHLKA